jgi:hypothetical protein
MEVVDQVRAQVLCSFHVDEVTHITGGGSVFNPESDFDHMSNADISEILSLADDHGENNAGEEEVIPSLAKSNNPGRAKKKNTAARFAAALSKDPQAPKCVNPKIARKTSELKVAECDIFNMMTAPK